jgi:hypothetical protein
MLRACALIASLAAPLSAQLPAWRIPIEVAAAGVTRLDKVVEANLADLPPGTDGASARMFEIATDGRVLDSDVRFQIDPDPASPHSVLTFLLTGVTAGDSVRRFELRARQAESTAEDLVLVEKLDDYQGARTFKISTPRATYYYHMDGSGFASLIDLDGQDWISYRPQGGFEGDYRGIPNIAPPQMHAGRSEGKRATRLLRDGPLVASLLSATTDGAWRLVWDIFPEYARMRLLSKGPQPYWILYEGTPGGTFDPAFDYWFNSAGDRMPSPPVGERWNGRLPAPQWVYFGDAAKPRTLFLALDPADDLVDEYWHRGPGGMTVFGFGRGEKPQWQYLEAVPAQLTIGLIEADQFDEVSRRIESVRLDATVSVGALESN